LRHLRLGEVDAEQCRGGDQEHDDGGLHRAIDGGANEVRKIEVAVDDAADHERRDDGNPGAFRGGDDAAEDGAEDDHRHDQRPAGFLERDPHTADTEPLFHRPIMLQRQIVGDRHHGETAEQPGDDARHEELHDGAPRHHAVKDHRDRGRDDDGEARRG
jgi:hypothetical protein